MLELLIILVALCCAPYMLAGMFRLTPPPSPPQLWRVVAPAVVPALVVTGRVIAFSWYYVKPFMFHGYKRAPEERPRLSTVSSAHYVEQDADEAADEAADEVSALFEAARRLQVDRTRPAIIDTLLLAGWEPGAVRGAVRGDNNVVQAEINAARVRLGLKEPGRVIPMRDSNGTREVAL